VSTDGTELGLALSAVQDGRATARDWALVESAWARDPALRERWLLWQTAGDGLRSPDLLMTARRSEELLKVLHAAMPAAGSSDAPRREWLAPLAVAASFVALALGVTQLRPAEPPRENLAVAPGSAPVMQGLAGTSFAQTAAGRTLAASIVASDAAWPAEPALGWPDSTASQAGPAASEPGP
jgi:negative regulator of sigma E activity